MKTLSHKLVQLCVAMSFIHMHNTLALDKAQYSTALHL